MAYLSTDPNWGTAAGEQIDPNRPFGVDTANGYAPTAMNGGSLGTLGTGGGKFAGMDPQQAFMQAVQDLGLTPQAARGHLDQVANYLNANGMTGWSANVSRPDNDVIDYGGKTYDVIPAGDAGFQWGLDASMSGAPGGASGGSNIFGTSGMGGPFTPPTGVNYMNDPGYQFRLDQAARAVQNSAAAKGTLLTGGTLKDLVGYVGNQASGEYGNVFNRALQTHSTNFGDLYNLSNLGMNATVNA